MYNDKRYSLLIQATNCTRRISIFFFLTKTTFFTLHPNLSSHNPETATLPVVYPSYPKDNGGKKWKAVSIQSEWKLAIVPGQKQPPCSQSSSQSSTRWRRLSPCKMRFAISQGSRAVPPAPSSTQPSVALICSYLLPRPAPCAMRQPCDLRRGFYFYFFCVH